MSRITMGDEDDGEDRSQLFEMRTSGGGAGNSSPYSSLKAKRARRRPRNPWDAPDSDEDGGERDDGSDTDPFLDSEMDSDAELLNLGTLPYSRI